MVVFKYEPEAQNPYIPSFQYSDIPIVSEAN